MIRRLMFGLLALFAFAASADDALVQQLLARVRQSGAACFHYDETRKLELATEAWNGEGYMLSGADGSLVKLQLKPTRLIMAITDQQMVYWDPEQRQRHSAPLSYGGPAEQIRVFRAILQGRGEELQAAYRFAAETRGQQWLLTLAPNSDQAGDDAPTVEISGVGDDGARRLSIRQPDGDATEYRMTKAADDAAPDIRSLLREALGD